MSKGLKIGIVIAVVLGVMVLSCQVIGYNSIIDEDEAVMASWGEVENQYQRRAELIPNLVATVKGEADFEKDTLTELTEARSSVAGIKVDASMLDDPERFQQYEQAQRRLSSSLSRLLMVSERYPTLQANQAFRDLRSQLEGTENRIAVARKRYIDSVAQYNAQVRKFPTSVGASMRGLDVRPTFQATVPGADVAPKVEF
ncbi:LemA family protein [Paraliomyxa miuraensis]|uniref:LemA family protein n=1 Tax=Paraliomyxa miuraensis TaxID=376150 RepID=UPI00225B4C80|nr:LemA family protein [Paraliomyxa miuraensis]MCX4245339.1 LemA family protein [Paraliomyxa miuraensis]